MSHSRIAPSSASRWAPKNGCPGSVGMSERFPEKEKSIPAEQGTAAHELAAMMVTAHTKAGAGYPIRDAVIGQQAANGVVFDDEMYDGAEVYANHIKGVMTRATVFGGDNIGIEASVHAPSIHPESFGTVDFYLFDKEANHLHIYDFKYGFGVVEEFENWQLINYAAGIIDTLKITSDPVLILNVVQPRAFHQDGPIRGWGVRASELTPFFDQLRAGALAALDPNAPVHSGAHCKYCRARHACEAALTAGMQLYEVSTEAIPLEMEPDELALVYTIVSRASAQLSALSLGYETQLKAMAAAGTPLPGYRPETTYGWQKWTKPYKEIVKLGELMGKDLRQKKAITPKQAENLGVDSALINAYSEKPKSGIKLVRDDNSKARKVFSS